MSGEFWASNDSERESKDEDMGNNVESEEGSSSKKTWLSMKLGARRSPHTTSPVNRNLAFVPVVGLTDMMLRYEFATSRADRPLGRGYTRSNVDDEPLSRWG